jgi:hypothetical protein
VRDVACRYLVIARPSNAAKGKETEMNVHESRNRLATGIRTATIVIVLGTLAAVWRPMHSADVSDAPATPRAVSALPDMTVYFPDRFPAPQGPVEDVPPTF